MTHFRILDTGENTPEKNMAIDAELLENLKSDDAPILHLYEWSTPSITYGHFVKLEEHMDKKAAEKWGLSLGKRPTGGGILFHTVDYAFSFLIPANHPWYSENVLENYKVINTLVTSVIASLNQQQGSLLASEPTNYPRECERFCMAKPTKYDVMLEGKKIAGAAQRKKKQGFLHQGSIALTLPPKQMLEEVLLHGKTLAREMKENAYLLLGESASKAELESMRQTIKQQLMEHVQ